MTVRERYREQTREEAKRIALEQLAESGPGGVSVNAIARKMGITGPALYRYFAGRDDLLTELIADAYAELADTVEQASAAKRAPAARLRAMANAWRDWAIAQPHRYLLLFGTPIPGYQAPEHTLAAAHRTLVAFAMAFEALDVHLPKAQALDRQVAALLADRQVPVSAGALRFALMGWTRLHGVVSLEVEGQFTLMGVDPGLLFQAEVDAFLANHSTG
jgi:AcrR family transcriptional regulator